MLARETAPFVLLDDAREDAVPARLYRRPVRVVEARTIAEVLPALDMLRAARDAGLHAAGFLSYDAGAAFEPVLGMPRATDAPLLWFGLFEGYEEIAAAEVPALLPNPAGAWIAPPQPGIDQATYHDQFARVLDLIAAGDVYQINLSYRATVRHAGDPLALYAQLRARARAGFGALIDTGADLFLSLSPELFFALDDRRLTCRPMKGTVRRGATPAEDQALAASLSADPKQRAENLMIVDLMRNDLSRIARPGSVAVPALFTVETYPTVHTMVSTVTADLAEDRDAIDVLAALFPCGSVTGAPKIRAMQAIAEVEQASQPRGVYTGAIGRLDADGDAMFNVAIRTLAIRRGDAHDLPEGAFGVGGGIVADSKVHEEWDECLAKGDFLTSDGSFDLIETMAFDPETGMPLLERHLARMKASADLFGFPFDRHAVRNELQAATFRLRRARRIRLVLAKSGAIAVEVSPMPGSPAEPVVVALVPLPVDPSDFRLRHKISDRAFYGTPPVGCFEMVFIDPDGFLTEGSFTSLFVERNGILVTPPLARGLLPGVLRADLIATGRAIEGDLTPADLVGGFFIGNALRGLIPAIVAVANGTDPGL
ncbi:aminodeoxychorismate synthase component I [Sphingomonas sp. QA11]|uniref:aminodeoxychorismate synthase component I n=1 Tax=Sphingomonas sp. QA11 TaxID=2950605 RepID=UPI00234B78C0|nr:aminodeoxychorismate synthase component I [Sphingomonas sp. QA11]WCM26393.1 aminodeoxychorismate synthase component I [Sphingomonas sp. QA11]